jgi:arsenate reductase
MLSAVMTGCHSLAAREESNSVVMVCEHGSVKSLIAASLFNKGATQRGLPYRATARGVSPDASVPTSIASALAEEGFDVSSFVPSKVSAAELDRAERVVLIGVDTKALDGGSSGTITSWQEVPAASLDYMAARASLMQHIEVLLDELESRKSR